MDRTELIKLFNVEPVAQHPLPEAEIQWPGIDFAISNNALKVFRESVVRYAGVYIYKTIDRSKPTPAMITGQLAHSLLFEPHKVTAEYIAAPTCGRSKNEDKAQWKEAEKRAAEERKPIITAEQFREAAHMAAAVHSHPVARELIARPGQAEAKLEVVDDFTGLRLQRRYDYLFDGGGELELKSTNRSVDPEEFGRTALNLGYDYAMAFGRHVAEIARPDTLHAPQWFVVVSSEEPYEVSCQEVKPDSLEMREAMRVVSADLAELARRVEQRDFRSRYLDPTEYRHPEWWRRRNQR